MVTIVYKDGKDDGGGGGWWEEGRKMNAVVNNFLRHWGLYYRGLHGNIFEVEGLPTVRTVRYSA